jgi:hypothetical protein
MGLDLEPLFCAAIGQAGQSPQLLFTRGLGCCRPPSCQTSGSASTYRNFAYRGPRSMSSFQLPSTGILEFPDDTDGHWEFEILVGVDTVKVDINTDADKMTAKMFNRVKTFLVDASRFESLARSAVRADYADDTEGSSCLYLSHHAEEFSTEERLKYFGSEIPDGLGGDQLQKAIHLKRIGLYPDSDDHIAVFDFTIDEDATDYVLAVQFDEAAHRQESRWTARQRHAVDSAVARPSFAPRATLAANLESLSRSTSCTI